MSGLEKDMPGLKNDTHATLPETAFEQVASIECGLTKKGLCSRFTVLGAVAGLVGVAPPALGAFFHLIISIIR
jgi:hypothetical protein